MRGVTGKTAWLVLFDGALLLCCLLLLWSFVGTKGGARRKLLEQPAWAQSLTGGGSSSSAANTDSGDSSGSGCKKLLWFTGLVWSRGRTEHDYENLRVALLSARRHAPTLVPVLMYTGESNEFTTWFEQHGGHVVPHTLSFLPALEDVKARDGIWGARLLNRQGMFLRLDVPLVLERLFEEQRSFVAGASRQYALYTDTDVMFLPNGATGAPQHFTTCTVPLPAGPLSLSPGVARRAAESSGVMVINAPALAAETPAIVEFAAARQFNFERNDQGLINEYLASTNRDADSLPAYFSWKGFWGTTGSFHRAAIFHWQGPKPRTCLPCLLDFMDSEAWEQQCRQAAEGRAGEAGEGEGDAAAAGRRSPTYSCTDAGLGMLRQAWREDGGELYSRMVDIYEGLLKEAGELTVLGAWARRRHGQQQRQEAAAAEAAADAAAEAAAGLSEEQLQLLQ